MFDVPYTKNTLITSTKETKMLQYLKSQSQSQSTQSTQTQTLTSESNKFVLIDFSGSTGGQRSYWDTVLRIIETNQDATFVLWDTSAHTVSLAEATKVAKNCTGNGGTQPQCFAKLLPNNSNLIIITDGQVGQSDVLMCDTILNSK